MAAVRLYVPEMTTTYVPTHLYEYKPGKKWKWLQRLCLRVLDKIGCGVVAPRINIEIRDIELTSIIDAIKEQTYRIEYVYGRKPTHIIVGSKAMHQIGHEAADYMRYVVSPSTTQYTPVTLWGMKLITVPWFDGGVICLSLED